MTAEALTAPVELSAAVSSGPAAACERRGGAANRIISEQGRPVRWAIRGLCTSFWQMGANMNFTESSGTGFQPGEKRSVSVPGGTKRPLVGLESLGIRIGEDPPD